MSTLYIDNCRGFNSTFLTLKDVNFFVGENSTGKTSILKLIGIISSPKFWRYGEFGDEETSLGNFSDIINAKKSHDFFEVGILNSESYNDTMSAIKFRFIGINDKVSLKEIWLIASHFNVQISIEGKILKYRFKNLSTNQLTYDKSISFFKKWVLDNKLEKVAFNRQPIEFPSVQSILLQVSITLNNQSGNSLHQNFLNISGIGLLNGIAWFSPIRSEPRESYSEIFSFRSEGFHAPSVLKSILPNKYVRKIIQRFGKDSGLYDDIVFENVGDKTDKPSPFRLLLNLEGNLRSIKNVGYGISQILPLIVEIIARPDNTWFAIQQPEVHLHPKAQAAFGEFVYKSVIKDGQKFIIETHSDFTIDRFRLRLKRAFKENSHAKNEVAGQVVFFSRHKEGNRLEAIEILKNGSYGEKQPELFRDFFIREQLNLVKI